jgi:hypothetical protein
MRCFMCRPRVLARGQQRDRITLIFNYGRRGKNYETNETPREFDIFKGHRCDKHFKRHLR